MTHSDQSDTREALETLAIAAGPEALDWAVNRALRHRGNLYRSPVTAAAAVGEHLQLLALRERFESLGGRWAR